MKFFSIQNRRVSRGVTYWLGVGIVGLVAGIGIQFTQAWTNPSGTAPAGNVAGPITTGSSNQWKTGSLGLGTGGPADNYIGWTSALEINGQAKATRYYDDDPNFYVDANTTSIMNVVQGSSFSDRENPGYYLDPSNTNRLNYILANNIDSFDWVRGTHFIDRDNGGYHLDPNNGNRLNYVLADNLDSYGWVRGTHFIDRNDGNYYVDPNGNSRLNATYNNYVYSYGNMDANDYYVRSIGKWVSQIGGGTVVTGGDVTCPAGKSLIARRWTTASCSNYGNSCNLYQGWNGDAPQCESCVDWEKCHMCRSKNWDAALCM